MSRMDFTDEQIMQYVDGDASPELASNISNARVKDKELEARIYKFQLANTVMLKHTKEKKEMPELLYARLRKKRIEKEESLEKKKRALFSFGNFGSGAIAASIAAFGIFIGTGAYQLQTTSNESLAREFYSSFQAGERSDQLVNEIKLANVGVFLDKERIVIISKSDLISESALIAIKNKLNSNLKGITTHFISSVSNSGIQELKDLIWEKLNTN